MTDDELILYYYRDEDSDGALSPADCLRIEQALAADPELARRYEALSRDLDGLRADTPPPAPPAAVASWHDAIDGAAERESRPARPQPLMWFAAMAAVLVLGVGIGLSISRQDAPPQVASPQSAPSAVTAPQTAPPRARLPETGTPQTAPPPVVSPDTGRPEIVPERVASQQTDSPEPTVTPTPGGPTQPTMAPAAFRRGLASYILQSRQQLFGLEEAAADQRTELIARIIEQNRLFEQRADASGSAELARVLRAFEQTLTNLAEQEASRDVVAEDADQLSFEMAAMLTRLPAPASQTPYSF